MRFSYVKFNLFANKVLLNELNFKLRQNSDKVVCYSLANILIVLLACTNLKKKLYFVYFEIHSELML